MQREIAVAEPKPVLTAKRADAVHERPRLVTPAPAGDGIVETSENVGQRVDIGRDAQPKMLEIVAGVGDHEQFVGRQDAAQTERQFRAADPAGQRHDKSLAHQNMSSAAGRTIVGTAPCQTAQPASSIASAEGSTVARSTMRPSALDTIFCVSTKTSPPPGTMPPRASPSPIKATRSSSLRTSGMPGTARISTA